MGTFSVIATINELEDHGCSFYDSKVRAPTDLRGKNTNKAFSCVVPDRFVVTVVCYRNNNYVFVPFTLVSCPYCGWNYYAEISPNGISFSRCTNRTCTHGLLVLYPYVQAAESTMWKLFERIVGTKNNETPEEAARFFYKLVSFSSYIHLYECLKKVSCFGATYKAKSFEEIHPIDSICAAFSLDSILITNKTIGYIIEHKKELFETRFNIMENINFIEGCISGQTPAKRAALCTMFTSTVFPNIEETYILGTDEVHTGRRSGYILTIPKKNLPKETLLLLDRCSNNNLNSLKTPSKKSGISLNVVETSPNICTTCGGYVGDKEPECASCGEVFNS